jgi:hypothetical protein
VVIFQKTAVSPHKTSTSVTIQNQGATCIGSFLSERIPYPSALGKK